MLVMLIEGSIIRGDQECPATFDLRKITGIIDMTAAGEETETRVSLYFGSDIFVDFITDGTSYQGLCQQWDAACRHQ